MFADDSKCLLIDPSLRFKREPICQLQKSLLAIGKGIRVRIVIKCAQFRFWNVASSGPDDIGDLSMLTIIQSRQS
jgi:hypothetical protein